MFSLSTIGNKFILKKNRYLYEKFNWTESLYKSTKTCFAFIVF